MRVAKLFLLLLIMSCGTAASERKPDDLIPEDSMVQVLAEVHLLEAAINIAVPTNVHPPALPGVKDPNGPPVVIKDKSSLDSLGYYNIFSTFHITKQRYDSSMKWYCTHPDVLNAMYDKVETELTKREMKEAR